MVWLPLDVDAAAGAWDGAESDPADEPVVDEVPLLDDDVPVAADDVDSSAVGVAAVAVDAWSLCSSARAAVTTPVARMAAPTTPRVSARTRCRSRRPLGWG